MITLGITGGIGCGKSFVCSIFGQKGVPIYDSDQRTKELYAKDTELLTELVALLGTDILQDGKLRREVFANKIFNDSKLMSEVKSLVYPAVMRDFASWKAVQDSSLVIMESAVILENEIVRRDIDKVLTVYAPLDVRIDRVINRDGTTKEQVIRRMQSQWSDINRLFLSDYVIINTQKHSVELQVQHICNKLSNLVR